MRKKFRLSLISALMILQLFSVALVNAEKLKIGASILIPPYVITDSNSGMELDIAREALAFKGYEAEFVYLPLLRVSRYLEEKKIDCGLSMKGDDTDLKNVYYSDSHITYRNVAITLESRKLKIASFSDLTGKTISTFQNAAKYLGPDFAKASEKGLKYREISKLNEFIPLLFQGRTDVVISDVVLFKYYRKEDKKTDTSAAIKIHEIFSPAMLKAGFLEKKVRDDFNGGLRHLRETGRYEKIVRKYIGE